MTNAKPTPGTWRDHVMVLSRNDQKSLLRQENTIVRRGRDVIAMVFGVTSDEEKANAALIAEAGTVFHETGLTPRELAEQRDELLAIVQRFIALPSGAWHPIRHAAEEAELAEDARAAIAAYKEHKGGANAAD